ncbi:MAG: hypothetical protein JOZ90_02995 [Alphaproteobacteria bacterium]|nr:hypothetical protein [Alphaproteobacteria bacterium]MBV9370445.1 hypothetical protein [Alphaproteobacteria bacterium]MBV9900045.1 hypothetical protein [Alphaproteobacteria bacterium]
MSAAPSPRWFPHYYDASHDAVLLVEKSEADYRAASFLDDRALGPQTARHLVPWAEVAEAVPADARRDVQYIFHIGHVGSTLISRLLGELPEVLALREPVVLRDFAERLEEAGTAEALWDPASVAGRLDALTALLSRTFRPGQRAMVKATSFVSEQAAALVPAESRALLLYAQPRRYIANILGGANSRQELAATAQARLRRLHRRAGAARWNLWEMGEGERIGMAWACEMGSLVQAAGRLGPGRVLWMDFDAFLAAPAAGLRALARFFGLDADAAGALAAHPLAGRYSKAPEHEYTPALRETVLAGAVREHGAALEAGLRWLDAAADASPPVAQALATASTHARPPATA